MSVVYPREFVDAFHSVIGGWNSRLAALWSNPAEYTRMFLGKRGDDVSSPLLEVANKLGLEYWPEYLKIDGAFYKIVNETDVIYVALEHENRASGSRWEMNKLCLLNAPLKVLVTYPHKYKSVESLLDMYTSIIRTADTFYDFESSRRQIVIFGEKPASNVVWQSFEYVSGRFVRMHAGASP